MKKEKPETPRRPYQAPELRKVRIRLDEALLTGCKTGQQLGPSSVGCGSGSPCHDITS